MAAVCTFGETLGLVRSGEPGGLETAHDARFGIGGAESNVAVGLSRLGVPVAWTGRVGDDGLGRRVVRELRAEGVEVTALVDPGAPTGLMLKEQRTAATTRVHYYRRGSAGSRIGPDDLDHDAVRAAAVLHVTGITASVSGSGRDAVLAAVQVAREAGVPVSFDVNHRTALWATGDPGALYRRIAAQSTVVFAGEDEAALLAPGVPGGAAALAAAVAALGPREVVVKRGALGCAGVVDGAAFDVPAVPVQVVDSVGAGDAFVAGYLAARLAGDDLPGRLLLATTCGAFACLGAGDWESLPRREELALLSAAEPVQR